MFSSKAEDVIHRMRADTLCPEVFVRFLKETYRKHQKRVLSILESCTDDDEGVRRQLLRLKHFLLEAHEKCLAEHKKDLKLETRVSALIVMVEELQKRPQLNDWRQIGRDNMVIPADNEAFSPAVDELINEMIYEHLTPGWFKSFLFETHGKYKTHVLEILRSSPVDPGELKKQLLVLKNSLSKLRENHEDYLEHHKKDTNLDKRVQRLISIIEMEQRREHPQRRERRSAGNI